MSEERTLSEIRRQIEEVAAKLTTKQKRFCDQWLVNGENGTSAYMIAFGNENAKSASVGACKLLKKGAVRAYIDLCRSYTTDEVLNRLVVTKDRVLDEEANLAFIDIRKMFDVNGEMLPPQYWPEELARAAASVEIDQTWDKHNEKWKYKYKVKLNDKGRALQRLETVLGMNKIADLTDESSNMFKAFLESIDGSTRGRLPADIEDKEG